MYRWHFVTALVMFGIMTIAVTLETKSLRILLLAPVFILYLASVTLFGYEYDDEVKKGRKRGAVC
jgi:hypothetical protein